MIEEIGTDTIVKALGDKIDLANNEELEVTVNRKRREKAPPFIAVGNGKSSKEFTAGVVMDAFDVIGSLSPKQIKIFLHFKDQVVQNHITAHRSTMVNTEMNHVHLPKSGDPKADLIRTLLGQNKNAQTMIDKKIIKRISSYEYMVNPYILIPTQHFKEVLERWEALP